MMHWLFMAILSSGIFLSQEVSYYDRKADAIPIAEKYIPTILPAIFLFIIFVR
jgi:hypothetical protein